MKRRWTKNEKWLFGAPFLVGVFALAAQFGPELVRKRMGLPRELKTFPNYRLYYVAVSSDGSTLAASGKDDRGSQHDETVLFWDART